MKATPARSHRPRTGFGTVFVNEGHLRHHGSKGKENPSGVYGPRNGHEQYVHLMDKGNGVGCGGNFGKMNGGSEIGFA
eukprot:scaffold146322_cov34-Tisochrysis_lutea.AAC.6